MAAAIDGLPDVGSSSSGSCAGSAWADALAQVPGDMSGSDGPDEPDHWQDALANLGDVGDVSSPELPGDSPNGSSEAPSPKEEEDMDLALVPARLAGLGSVVLLSHMSRWRDDDAFNANTLQVAQRIVEDEALVTTTVATAKEHGMPRRSLPILHAKMAAAAVQLERHVWRNVEERRMRKSSYCPTCRRQAMTRPTFA